MSEKLCVFCPHFSYERIREYSYSEYTAGTEGGFSCARSHFYEVEPWDNDDFRKLILRAESCSDYTPEALSPKLVGRVE